MEKPKINCKQNIRKAMSARDLTEEDSQDRGRGVDHRREKG